MDDTLRLPKNVFTSRLELWHKQPGCNRYIKTCPACRKYDETIITASRTYVPCKERRPRSGPHHQRPPADRGDPGGGSGAATQLDPHNVDQPAGGVHHRVVFTGDDPLHQINITAPASAISSALTSNTSNAVSNTTAENGNPVSTRPPASFLIEADANR